MFNVRCLCLLLMITISDLVFGQRIEKLPASVNSEQYDEILPVLNEEGNKLYFTRIGYEDFVKYLRVHGENVFDQGEQYGMGVLTRVYANLEGRPIDPVGSEFNQEIFQADIVRNKVVHVQQLGLPINNALPNSILAYDYKTRSYLLNNQFPKEGGMRKGISVSKPFSSSVWAEPSPLSIEGFHNESIEMSLGLNYEGDVMILSLNTKGSKGENDLFLSRRIKGTWTKPMVLGGKVNSPHMESNPTLSRDGKTLFFSSNRVGSKGMDIYYSQRLGSGWDQWSDPIRLEEPINSDFDDSQALFDDHNEVMYFSSNREGSSDIYKVSYSLESSDDIILQVRVKDAKTKLPKPCLLRYKEDGKRGFRSINIGSDGTCELDVSTFSAFTLYIDEYGYIPMRKEVYLAKEEDGIYEMDLLLQPYSVDDRNANTILFERSSLDFVDSYSLDFVIESFIEEMKKLPKVVLNIEGHTDDQGSWKRRQELSKERADLVASMFADKGLPAHRIRIVAYGGERPLNSNISEEDRAQNRRVELHIVEN